MARTSYQYGTSPRKYEPEYTPKRTKKVETQKRISKKEQERIKAEKEKEKKILEKKKNVKQMITVFAIFAMLLTISYREISIMEMFDQKKDMENQLALVEKENGQVEKNIEEEESKLDWNKIKQIATEELGMQKKEEVSIDLNKTDSVETQNTYIKEQNESFIEKIIEFFINR